MSKPFLIIFAYILAFLVIICSVEISKKLIKESKEGNRVSEVILILASGYGIMTIIIELLNKIL